MENLPNSPDKDVLIISNFFVPQNNIAVRRIRSFATDLQLGNVQILTTKKDARFDGQLDLSIPLKNTDHLIEVAEIPYANPVPVTEAQAQSTVMKQQSMTSLLLAKIKRFMSPDLLDRRLPFLFGSIRWLLAWRKLGAKPKFVLSSSPLSINHLIGLFAAKLFDAIWIVDYRDLWTLDPFRRGIFPFSLMERLLELGVTSQADLILTVSNGQKSAIQKMLPRANIEVIRNGVDERTLSELNALPNITRSGPLRILYLGTVIPGKRDVEQLFAAIRILKTSGALPDIRLSFYGTTHDDVCRIIMRHDVSDIVESHPQISSKQALLKYADADALLFLDWIEPRVPGVLTGKLFEYLASGITILSITENPDSEANELIKKYNAGFVALNRKDDLATSLLNLAAKSAELRKPRKIRSDAKDLSRETIAQHLSLVASALTKKH